MNRHLASSYAFSLLAEQGVDHDRLGVFLSARSDVPSAKKCAHTATYSMWQHACKFSKSVIQAVVSAGECPEAQRDPSSTDRERAHLYDERGLLLEHIGYSRACIQLAFKMVANTTDCAHVYSNVCGHNERKRKECTPQREALRRPGRAAFASCGGTTARTTRSCRTAEAAPLVFPPSFYRADGAETQRGPCMLIEVQGVKPRGSK